ncbi:MAG: hypothetical protein WBA64_12060 [Marinomonas sp.]|uniref:hypothetical protein n=1 Tax=Marinomonas sp. TaxID=1904862 RepID=UPI003C77421A
MESKYELKTLDDILSIPSDRLDVFFAEFIPHVKDFRAAKDVLDLLSFENLAEMGLPADAVSLKSMTWVDDGKKDVTTNMTLNNSENTTSTITVKRQQGE